MDSPIGPDGLPAAFEGGVWVSHDRRYYWNGAAWVASKSPASSPWLVKGGIVLMLVALLGYAVYTTVSTASEFAVGYYVGVAIFFGILIAIFRFAGRWGCFGVVVRAGCGLLAILKILTFVAHPPPT